MSKTEMKKTVEMQFDGVQLWAFGIFFFFFFSASLAMMIIGFVSKGLEPLGWGGLALLLWVSLIFVPFLVFYGRRYFHYLRHAEDYVLLTAHFAPGGSYGMRYGCYFSAQFVWEGKPLAIDTHSVFTSYAINLFDLPLIVDYANKENQIAYNPKDGTIVVVGLV
jgi:hypothetical protein